MNRRWGIVIILFGLIMLLLIVYFIFFYNFNPQETIVNENTPAPAAVGKLKIEPTPVKNTIGTTTEIKNKPQPVSGAEANKLTVKRLAVSFAERYGSFSSQSDYGNIKDLEIFMTEKLNQHFAELLAQLRTNRQDYNTYTGITTKALSSELKSYTDKDEAEVLVHTRRRQVTTATQKDETFFQDILIKFVFDNNSWKADYVAWQEKKNN